MNASDNEGENLPKRRRIRSTTTPGEDGTNADISSSLARRPDPVGSVSDTAMSPTSGFSKELSKIVDTDHYSILDSLLALNKMFGWAYTEDSSFFNFFATHAGVAKVLNFLKATLDEDNCVGSTLKKSTQKKCVVKAVKLIGRVCHWGEGIDIAVKIGKTAVKYDGIHILLAANEEYTCGNDPLEFEAVKEIWNALMHIIYSARAEIRKDQANCVFRSGIDIMAKLRSVDDPVASDALDTVFRVLIRIVDYECYVPKKELQEAFQEEEIISHCLKVFKQDDTWSTGNENLMSRAIEFFGMCCDRKILVKGSEFVELLPLYVKGLKEFPTNTCIRERALSLINDIDNYVDAASSNRHSNRALEKSGAVALAQFLTSDVFDDYEKSCIRDLMIKIMLHGN